MVAVLERITVAPVELAAAAPCSTVQRSCSDMHPLQDLAQGRLQYPWRRGASVETLSDLSSGSRAAGFGASASALQLQTQCPFYLQLFVATVPQSLLQSAQKLNVV